MACVSKIGSMYVLVTNGVIDTTTDVVYGVNPVHWRALPCEGVALLKIRQAPPTTGAALPVSIAVPTRSTVTTVGDGSSCCTVSNIPLIDPINDPFVGADIVNNTEHLIYFNKLRGLIRVLDCCRPAAPTTAEV